MDIFEEMADGGPELSDLLEQIKRDLAAAQGETPVHERDRLLGGVVDLIDDGSWRWAAEAHPDTRLLASALLAGAQAQLRATLLVVSQVGDYAAAPNARLAFESAVLMVALARLGPGLVSAQMADATNRFGALLAKMPNPPESLVQAFSMIRANEPSRDAALDFTSRIGRVLQQLSLFGAHTIYGMLSLASHPTALAPVVHLAGRLTPGIADVFDGDAAALHYGLLSVVGIHVAMRELATPSEALASAMEAVLAVADAGMWQPTP